MCCAAASRHAREEHYVYMHAALGDDSKVHVTRAEEGQAAAAVDADTIRKVAVDEVQLEAIAEEVQLSWRLKEIRAEQLMQKAVARSERPWLIFLSSMFTATVVLLMLVLYRLYFLENNPLALLLL